MVMARSEADQRIGLLGGTFDPIHKGHLELAGVAARELDLDSVLFIPSAIPPHKPEQALTDFFHREKMIQLALADLDRMDVSSIERSLPTPSYTIDTLMALDKVNLPGEFYYITGLDTFLEIKTWKSYNTLFQRTHFIVVARSGYSHSRLDELIRELGFMGGQESGWFNPFSQKRLFFVEKEIIHISSSEVRELIQSAGDLRPFLPQTVIQYIMDNKLYVS